MVKDCHIFDSYETHLISDKVESNTFTCDSLPIAVSLEFPFVVVEHNLIDSLYSFRRLWLVSSISSLMETLVKAT